MIPAFKDLTTSRVVSAAGALVMTSVILLAIGLGFPASASAQAAPSARAGTVNKAAAVKTSAAALPSGASVERGRYLVAVGGCNDCHTAGYSENGGTTPAADWLTGLPVGFRGPWGVSYPSNLRLTVQGMSEADWLKFSRAQRLPPMPWWALRDMSDEDLRSVFRFIRDLGPKGERMPAAIGPDGKVTTPYIQFTPQNLPAAVALAR